MNAHSLIGGEKWRDLSDVKIHGTVYYRNTKVRDYLNKVLKAGFKAAFTEDTKYDLGNYLDYSGEEIYVVTSTGSVAVFTNSEWASIQAIKEEK